MPFTRCLPPSVPPSFPSLLQCLHMQSLSECAMSFLLGSAASFTVDWFLSRSRGNGPPFPIILPSSLPSSPPPPGQAAGVGNGPDVRCMVDGRAAPAPRAPAAGGSAGLCCPCVPRAPPHPTPSRRQGAELPPHPPLSASPAPQTAGPAHPQPPGRRQEQARLFRAGEVCPSRANLLRNEIIEDLACLHDCAVSAAVEQKIKYSSKMATLRSSEEEPLIL
ncbi:protein enabled homolog [Camarhynchus parvulus]|uniref:protein enabled homolog n=1 Tax=Geospiza parvula TaxID=87175 RepID=UPI001238362B|nr:protein enabled homolog [Camarhynchus parvulus]